MPCEDCEVPVDSALSREAAALKKINVGMLALFESSFGRSDVRVFTVKMLPAAVSLMRLLIATHPNDEASVFSSAVVVAANRGHVF